MRHFGERRTRKGAQGALGGALGDSCGGGVTSDVRARLLVSERREFDCLDVHLERLGQP